MMIDRKTALLCAALIAVMLAAALARMVILGDWPRRASLSEALRLWQFFVLPFIAAMLVTILYANGRHAVAAEARLQLRYAWGWSLALAICLCSLLVQELLIASSLGLFDSRPPRLHLGLAAPLWPQMEAGAVGATSPRGE